MTKLLHVIVACSENRVIGRAGQNPWRIPEDMKFFHDETAGQLCIMGRICYENWPRAGLEGRRPIVVASKPLPTRAGQAAPIVVGSLAAALTTAETLAGEVFV